MSAAVAASSTNRSSLFQAIAVSGLLVALGQIVVMQFLIISVVFNTPFLGVLQAVAAAVLGAAAFEGGIATALVGLLIHLLVSQVVAGIFVLSVDRIALLRKNVVIGGLVYGLVVGMVMNYVVVPLTPAPPVPFDPFTVMVVAVEHTLVVGLILGLMARRRLSASQSSSAAA